MWGRPLADTDRPCSGCRAAGRKLAYKQSVRADGGPRPGYYTICRYCDGARDRARSDVA